MKTFFLLICLFFTCEIFAQTDFYMHGTYEDVDWETLEFVGPRAAAMEKIYYNYHDARQGKITLRKQSAYRSKGVYYYTVTFPNISSVYYITLDPTDGKCTMRDDRGTYYKEFFSSGKREQKTVPDYQANQTLIQKVKMFINDNGKYCPNDECDRLLQYGSGTTAGMIKYSIYEKDMKFTFGDINGDGQLDAIMNAPIKQCNGNTECCFCMEYIVALSQKSGKHFIQILEFPNKEHTTVYAPLRIEKDGRIFTKESYKVNDASECPCCANGERYNTYRFLGNRLYKD
ncbi:MAG: hypothetical protein ACO323_02190 [Candidatus Kapaibacteriota bacterium]